LPSYSITIPIPCRLVSAAKAKAAAEAEATTTKEEEGDDEGPQPDLTCRDELDRLEGRELRGLDGWKEWHQRGMQDRRRGRVWVARFSAIHFRG